MVGLLEGRNVGCMVGSTARSLSVNETMGLYFKPLPLPLPPPAPAPVDILDRGLIGIGTAWLIVDRG